MERKLTWDYEDSYNYAQDLSYQLAYELIQKEEQDSFVSQQVGISRKRTQALKAIISCIQNCVNRKRH